MSVAEVEAKLADKSIFKQGLKSDNEQTPTTSNNANHVVTNLTENQTATFTTKIPSKG